MYLSIVIPVKNEEKSLPVLYREILAAVKPLKKTFEIVFINDGSTDNSLAEIKKISTKDKRVTFVSFRGNFGKSAALKAGFEKTQGDFVVTLDADLQDDPAEIPKMFNKLNEGYDLVCGWKKERHDPIIKVLPSRIWNFITATLSGVKLHDFNCGLKAYRQEVAKSLPLYGELYRLIPILATEKRFRVTETPIHHRPRKYGQSKFGWDRFVKGFLDMITVVFLSKFIRRPAHFFGSLGLILFGIGFLIGLYIIYLKLVFGNILGRQPLLLGGILFMVIGIQLLSTGLIAEMITFFNNQKKSVY